MSTSPSERRAKVQEILMGYSVGEISTTEALSLLDTLYRDWFLGLVDSINEVVPPDRSLGDYDQGRHDVKGQLRTALADELKDGGGAPQ